MSRTIAITSIIKPIMLVVALSFASTANADFGVGFKAGTLGLGLEGRWSPIDWLDVRLGANQYDYEDDSSLGGIAYDGTLGLDTYYVTGNFRFPLSPFRVTAGAFSNNNELQLTNQDLGGAPIDIGGTLFTPAEFGSLQSAVTFDGISPYFGVGYDFEILDKVGLNFDFGVLWQGEPNVALTATGLGPGAPPELASALLVEQQQLEDDLSNAKAWPVLSLGFVYNF